MDQSPNNRRKNLIFDPPQQSRIILGITALPMTVLLAASVVLWVLTNRLFDEAQQGNVELPSLGLLAMTQFVFVLLAGAVAVVQAVRYSHRVVGPAHRIAMSLRRMRSGDTDFRVTLRKGDELQSILDELNPLLEQLQRERAAAATGQAEAEPSKDDAAATPVASHVD